MGSRTTTIKKGIPFPDRRRGKFAMSTGYLRDKNDIKYFILFAMSHLPFPISETDLLDICLIDDAFGYFEFSEAFAELQQTGHVRRLEDEEGKALYDITPVGREAAKIFEDNLRLSVRDKAQAAVIRVVRKIRRESSLETSHAVNPDGSYQVRLAINDQQAPVLALDVMVLNSRQCALLEQNFRKDAEKIYNDILKILLSDTFQQE